jgi:predicted O-methyltransferase YrrM
MVSFDEALLLYCLARDVRAGCVVEVGAYRGRSAVLLGLGSLSGAGAKVFAVDPHKEFVGVLGGAFGPKDRTAFYRAMLDAGCSEIVALINLSSEQFCSCWREEVALLWIDGDHSYEGVKRDFECWRPHLRRDGVVAFDDATDPALGPRRLITELIALDGYEEFLTVGKIAVIRKRPQRATGGCE